MRSGAPWLLVLGTLAWGCRDNSPGTVEKLQIEPANPTIYAGDTLRFHAAATYSSGQVADVQAIWGSYADSIVTVDSIGRATAALWGSAMTTLVGAKVGTLRVSTQVTVQPCGANCGSWSSQPGMIQPRLAYGGTAVVNGIVYVAGGSGLPLCGLDATWLDAYDPATTRWTVKAPMPDRAVVSAIAVGGLLYVVGTQHTCANVPDNIQPTAFYSYDPSRDAWTVMPRMPLPGTGGGADAFVGNIATVGGILYALHSGTQALYAFDPSANTWAIKASAPHSECAAIFLRGQLYAYCAASGYLDVYDAATNTWSGRAVNPRRRTQAWPLVDGRLYVVGGDYSAVDIYDPATNTWKSGTPLPGSRGFIFGSVLNGLIMVGRYGIPPWLGVYAYDPVRDKWMVKTPLSFPSCCLPNSDPFVVDGHLFIPFADGVRAMSNSSTWVFTP